MLSRIIAILISDQMLQRSDIPVTPYLSILFFCIFSFGWISVKAQKSIEPYEIDHAILRQGGLERMDTTSMEIYLTFTSDIYNDGGYFIRDVLKNKNVPAHFFLTGNFYRSKENVELVQNLVHDGHYLGPHSDKHLLYVAWENRDSTLITRQDFIKDLGDNYEAMAKFGISKEKAPWFMPPYEWYNQEISHWTMEFGSHIVNFSPGTRSNADYTTPDMGDRYIGSDRIEQSIHNYEASSTNGMKGFILLIHLGTHPSRTDKLYLRLSTIIDYLESKGYTFALLPELNR